MDKNKVTERAELESLHPAWMKVPTLSHIWCSHFCLLSPVSALQHILEITPRPQKIRWELPRREVCVYASLII